MVEPKFKCTLVGKQYHKNKPKFKKMLKDYGMIYSGTPAYPIWSGDSEYVRGEFERGVDEETGQEETKLATLSLFIKKDGEPTEFSDEFMDWCKEAKKSDTNSTIIEAEDEPKVDQKARGGSQSDWKRVVAFKFRKTGKKELSKQDIAFGISFDRKWASPIVANELVEKAIRMGYLKKKGDKLIPTFDVEDIGYSERAPDIDSMQSEAEYSE
jgi:hypothetical protein